MATLSYEQQIEIGYRYVRDQMEAASPYGALRLRKEGFYTPDQREELEAELDAVALFARALTADRTAVLDLRQQMTSLKDLRGTFDRCSEGTVLTEVELFELSSFCNRIRLMIPLAEWMRAFGAADSLMLSDMEAPLRILQPEEPGRTGFYIEDSRTPALLEARSAKRSLARLIRQERNESLLRQHQEAVDAEEKALAAIYADLSGSLRPYMPLFRKNADTAGRLDAALAKALQAIRFGCTRPRIGGNALLMTDAIHPQVASALERENRSFSPISIRMPQGVTVLTGANMGGKSIALKTVLLNTALALSGCFVFCREAEIPMFGQIDLISRDLSDAEQGLSSFGAEIMAFNEAAAHIPADELSLIVMDEFSRGTNAEEGAAIVRAAVKYLAGKNAVTLLATHYEGAAEYAVKHYQVKGLRKQEGASDLPPAGSPSEALRRIGEAMDYGLIEVRSGTECPHDAVRICRMLGLPQEMLSMLETD